MSGEDDALLGGMAAVAALIGLGAVAAVLVLILVLSLVRRVRA